VEHYDPVEWLRVIQVNLNAPFLLTQACLPLLKRAPDASVLFTSSGVGRRGRAYWGAYSASKFAIEGLMQVLADELDENSRVRVNSINPGRVRTAMRAAAYPAENPAELLTPQDIVLPYLYLLGPDSRDVHGRALDAQ
jgi:NAD(P)-dependent dehydrogenase (short-subunit alcohol dehydrogenase family)